MRILDTDLVVVLMVVVVCMVGFFVFRSCATAEGWNLFPLLYSERSRWSRQKTPPTTGGQWEQTQEPLNVASCYCWSFVWSQWIFGDSDPILDWRVLLNTCEETKRIPKSIEFYRAVEPEPLVKIALYGLYAWKTQAKKDLNTVVCGGNRCQLWHWYHLFWESVTLSVLVPLRRYFNDLPVASPLAI